MPYKFDFIDGDVVEWTTGAAGAEATQVEDYTPTIYVGVRDGNLDALEALATELRRDPKTVAVERERWFKDLRSKDRSPVLCVDCERIDEVATLAREIRHLHEFGRYAPGTFQLYNVDFSEEFRYCLETGTDPAPASEPTILELSIGEKPLADRDLSAVEMDGHTVGDSPHVVLEAIADALDERDPDVLRLNSSQLVRLLYEAADDFGADWFDLGRVSGYQQLAGESVFESYGVIGHSPARFNVPGRAIIDESNSFLWNKSGLQGLLDLTERSWKPLQEAGWASIGNLLTAIQIREAFRHRDVLIPWNKFQPEFRKDVETLHAADRGGFIFDPQVGFFEDVHELDFSSLYPNIMIEYNVSTDTIHCKCHPERTVVPELSYNICEERGLIPDVLEPIVEDRDRIKAAIAETDDPEKVRRLEERSDALKWILVTCFGYQGYKNSKFGRIEAHEAINAYARDILLQAKETFEANGWRIIHGIVDSIWVQAVDGESQTPLDELATEISEAVGIRLEYEQPYDWICFVPRREKSTGALTKYFGKVRCEDEYKIRGIEIRQRSTPPFIESVQYELMEVLDRHREPEPVCDRLQVHLSRLRAGDVNPQELVFRKRVSKRLEEYTQGTHTVSALMRYRDHGIEKNPGQDVCYVVVDDNARQSDRVRLHFELNDEYDESVYERELMRAAESIVSPLGWEHGDIRRYVKGTRDASIQAFD